MRFNNRPSAVRSVWLSVGVAVLLFFGMQIGFFYRDYLLLDEKKADLEAEIRSKDAFIARQKSLIISKDRQIYQLENKFRNLEGKSQMQTPDLYISPKRSRLTASRTIFIITATYERPTQKADLTRLSYTFCLVPNIFWIVVEDRETGPSDLVKNILLRSKIRHTLLHKRTPLKYRPVPNKPSWLRPRGVGQRNEGLKWLRTNIDSKTMGVVYFVDDDNTYDLQLFDEMRDTRKISVWPVAFVGQLMVERPDIKNKQVVGWKVKWRPERPYAVDMAGFAVNIELILEHRNAQFSYNSSRGYQETHFISQLISGLHELEPKADLCTKVYVWHTKTQKPNLLSEDEHVKSYHGIEF